MNTPKLLLEAGFKPMDAQDFEIFAGANQDGLILFTPSAVFVYSGGRLEVIATDLDMGPSQSVSFLEPTGRQEGW